jgi:hypothetical protein
MAMQTARASPRSTRGNSAAALRIKVRFPVLSARWKRAYEALTFPSSHLRDAHIAVEHHTPTLRPTCPAVDAPPLSLAQTATAPSGRDPLWATRHYGVSERSLRIGILKGGDRQLEAGNAWEAVVGLKRAIAQGGLSELDLLQLRVGESNDNKAVWGEPCPMNVKER